jgi:transcriptional regulator with XRE-family HTH domain
VRRKLSQQVFADGLGKSKSWVDKVERGVRSLDKVSSLQDIAAVLRIDAAVLLGRDTQPVEVSERIEGVERIRAALSRYEIALGRPAGRRPVLPVDRAMAAATGDRILVAAAAVQFGQVLRASGRAQLARSAMLAAAYRIAPPMIEYGTSAQLSLCGALLVQAALAAARAGDVAATVDLLDEATDMAERVGDGQDHHRTGFGPTAVELARVAAAVDLGEVDEAVARHEQATGRDGWRWLPAEHRAAHLLDAARAYLQVGDPVNACRVLGEADRTAPAEVRQRPAARHVLARIARDPDAPATVTVTVTQLADTLGVG